MENNSLLFETFSLRGKLSLKNRLVLAPLYLAWDGRSKEHRAFYLRRAGAGLGLVIAPQSGPQGLDDWRDSSYGRGFLDLIEGCHESGARIVVQVYPGGGPVDKMSREALAALPSGFARAAEGARAAGFDGIEVHGAHYSLLTLLLSPFRNHRSDEYGGSARNRWRVQVECVRVMRKAVGEEYPLFYRLSASDFVSGGLDLELTVPFAQALEDAGIDCLDVSAGTSDSPLDSIHPDEKQASGCFAPLAAAIRRAVDVPVIAVGKIDTRETAEAILRQGQADLIALGRPLIVDPDWPRKVLEGRDEEIVSCQWDNLGCLQNSVRQGKPIRCILNKEVGFEHKLH